MSEAVKGSAWPSPPPKYAANCTTLSAHTPIKSPAPKASTEDEADDNARPETPKTAIKAPQQPQENGSPAPEARSAAGVADAPLSDDEVPNASSTEMRDRDDVPAANESPRPEGAPAPAKKKRPALEAPRAKKKKKDVKQREGSKRERVPEGEADDRGKKVRLHRSDIIPITSSARWRGRPRRNDRDVSSSTQAKRPDIRNFFAKKDTS